MSPLSTRGISFRKFKELRDVFGNKMEMSPGLISDLMRNPPISPKDMDELYQMSSELNFADEVLAEASVALKEEGLTADQRASLTRLLMAYGDLPIGLKLSKQQLDAMSDELFVAMASNPSFPNISLAEYSLILSRAFDTRSPSTVLTIAKIGSDYNDTDLILGQVKVFIEGRKADHFLSSVGILIRTSLKHYINDDHLYTYCVAAVANKAMQPLEEVASLITDSNKPEFAKQIGEYIQKFFSEKEREEMPEVVRRGFLS